MSKTKNTTWKIVISLITGIMLAAGSNPVHARIIFSSDYLDVIYTNDSDNILNINNTNGLEFESTVAGNIVFDLQSTGDVVFQNAGTAFALFTDGGIFDLSSAEDTERIRLTDTTNADSVGIYTGLEAPGGVLSAEAGSLFLDQAGDAYINRSDGGSGITWGRLIAMGSPSQYAQTVEVAKSGAEFTSVKAALDSITDSNSGKRYTVLVYSGTYTEDPMSIPDYVSIEAVGNFENTIITASTAGSTLITAGLHSVVRNIQLEGATSSSCYQTSTASNIYNVRLKDCATGVYITGASGDLIANTVVVDEGTFIDVVKVDGGALAHVTALLINDGTITTGVRVTGNNSTLYAEDAWILASSITNGIYIDDTVIANIPRVSIQNATYGIHVGPNGSSTVQGPGGLLANNDTYDLYVESASAKVFLAGWRMNEDRLNIHESATVVLSFNDDTIGNESFTVVGELHVGTPERPHESVFGEGDSYTNGMMVYTYDTSVYTDVSASARSLSGSTFTLPGIAADNAIYISSDRKDKFGNFVKFLGYKLETDVTSLSPGTGEVIHEYWNGGSWAKLNTMCVHADLLYRYNSDCFLRPGSSEHMRFDEAITDDWVVNDPPATGTNRYWVRIRVKTAIVTTPVFEQFKIHSNRTEINGDGTMSFHGKARELRTFIVSPETIFFARGNNSPDNRAFTVGAGNISWMDDRSQAAFTGLGATMEELTGSIALPKGIDSSSSLIARIYWSKTNSDTGDVEWKLDYLVDHVKNIKVADGSNIAPAPRVNGESLTANTGVTVQTTATGDGISKNVPIMSEFGKLDIDDSYEGDTIFLRLYRDPVDVDDTYRADAQMLGFELSGVFWTTGEKL